MDMLILDQMPSFRQPRPQGPGAEEAYWRAQARRPRPALPLLVSLASIAGVILLLLGVGQV